MILTAVILTAVTKMVGTIWYVWLVCRGAIQPLLASWIIFTVTITISFCSYWNSPNHTIEGGIGNLTGVGSTLPILIAIIIVQAYRKELRVKFIPFQTVCLKISGGILVLWFLLRFVIGNQLAATTANVLTQFLLVIGYVVQAERLWKATKNTESLFTWSAICLAYVFAFYPAFEKHDLLSLAYATRALVTSSITIILIIRVRARVRSQESACAAA